MSALGKRVAHRSALMTFHHEAGKGKLAQVFGGVMVQYLGITPVI